MSESEIESEVEADNVFSYLSDDVVLNIFFKLVDDPRNWSRLACVCTKFSWLIRTICWKNKCHQAIPAVVSDLLPANSSITSLCFPPGGWASLHKLAVCCPGLVHSGVLLENSDFGLERDLGPDENYIVRTGEPSCSIPAVAGGGGDRGDTDKVETYAAVNTWSLYDDLYLDTVYNKNLKSHEDVFNDDEKAGDLDVVEAASDIAVCKNKKRKVCRCLTSHLASEVWNFSREQGNKLLASRFRGDCLYICDWPGCVHTEEKRNYMLFRGVFKDFKKSRVWRTINDGNRSKIELNCAFCPSNDVWDLHSAFCLRPAYGFHDDGEPVVRAFVCENGHVSGAWTDWPLYT
ncbi:phytochrome A-associated F-box protein-like [Bidens hawaiensis]|uniref:phytochrome A-associated F-box protein-like n=1 Tax=Bidens hawaiensis TaxID=980011 RepID=UPI0040492FBD